MNPNQIEERCMERGYAYVRHWRATKEDEQRGINDQYFPTCYEGDLLVTLRGYDPGSVAWVENWG